MVVVALLSVDLVSVVLVVNCTDLWLDVGILEFFILLRRPPKLFFKFFDVIQSDLLEQDPPVLRPILVRVQRTAVVVCKTIQEYLLDSNSIYY